MSDPFMDLEQDLTHLITAAAKNAAANGADVNGDAEVSRRKRGGQPGNQNARKHGFYSAYLPPEQAEDMESAAGLNDFAEDIAVMRVRLARLIRNPKSNQDLINRTFFVLARMMEVQRRYRFG